MKILVPKCGNALFCNFRRIQTTTPLSFVAYFRSTPASSEKWKDKWFNSQDFGDAKPSKTYIRYKTRQKRADAKKALNDIYFGSGSSKFTLEGELSKKRWGKSWDDDLTENRNRNRRDPSGRRWDDDPSEYRNRRDPFGSRWDDDPTERKNRRDPSARDAGRAHQRRKKSKAKRADFSEEFDEEDDDDPWTHFQAKFGNRRYSWSNSWEEAFSQSQTSGSKYSNFRNKWRTVSDDESSEDENSYAVGSHSDRIALGLPTNGPLKIEEVKSAFRLSALKWHPDKHQGPSQALAEEKFKLCASAYKSLCNALSQG